MNRKRNYYISMLSVLTLVVALLLIKDTKTANANIIINYSKDAEYNSKIQGKVLNDNNKPIKCAVIRVETSNKGTQKFIETKTDRNGYFDLRVEKNHKNKLAIKLDKNSNTKIIRIEKKLYTTQKFTVPDYKKNNIFPIPFMAY